jgi:O-antigen/teichoic acid export membrane protein
MSAEKNASLPTIDHKPHAAFFRQSGWLIITAVAGGFLTYLVHFLNKVINPAEYTAFGVLLTVVACLPVGPLQMVFTQQSALAIASGRLGPLSALIRQTFIWILILWALGAAAVLLFQNSIIAGWHLPGALSLWVTVILVPLSLWLPLFCGVLQGRQDFFWLGWSAVLSGGGRLAGAAVLVMLFGLGATGMMLGVLIGVGLGLVISVWRTRDLWGFPAEKFAWAGLLREAMPMMFGCGACQFLFTSDTMFAKPYFTDDQMKPYVLAGTLARAILWLVMPLATVMFPKLVQSRVKSEKHSNLFGLVVLGTAVLSICGAVGLWLVGPYVVKFVAHPSDVPATMALIPWYAGAMVPLAMANVLVNDLLARGRFRVVPFMVLLAVVYCISLPQMLAHFPGHIELALQILGFFNLLLFGLCALFTWGLKSQQGAAKSV